MKIVTLHAVSVRGYGVRLNGEVIPQLAEFKSATEAVEKALSLESTLGPYAVTSLRELFSILSSFKESGSMAEYPDILEDMNKARTVIANFLSDKPNDIPEIFFPTVVLSPMKTIKLHRTDSKTWRLLIDDKVHPLLVGFHTLTDAVAKMIGLYSVLGPFSYESLSKLHKNVKECLNKAWENTDVADDNVFDCGNTGAVLSAFIIGHYREESIAEAKERSRFFNIPVGSSFSEVMKEATDARREIKGVHLKGEVAVDVSATTLARKHDIQDVNLVEQIISINPTNPNIRLTGPHINRITWDMVMDDQNSKEVRLVGVSYDEQRAKDILERIQKLFIELQGKQ